MPSAGSHPPRRTTAHHRAPPRSQTSPHIVGHFRGSKNTSNVRTLHVDVKTRANRWLCKNSTWLMQAAASLSVRGGVSVNLTNWRNDNQIILSQPKSTSVNYKPCCCHQRGDGRSAKNGWSVPGLWHSCQERSQWILCRCLCTTHCPPAPPRSRRLLLADPTLLDPLWAQHKQTHQLFMPAFA